MELLQKWIFNIIIKTSFENIAIALVMVQKGNIFMIIKNEESSLIAFPVDS